MKKIESKTILKNNDYLKRYENFLLETDLLFTFNSGRDNNSVTIFGFPFATAKYNGVL